MTILRNILASTALVCTGAAALADDVTALPAKVAAVEFTLANVLEDAQKTVDAGLVEEGYGFYPRVSNGPDYAQFYQSFGGVLQDPETGKPVLDKAAMEEMYPFFADAVAEVETELPQESLSQLENAGYVVDDMGLAALAKSFNQVTADELAKLHGGAEIATRRDMERALKDLKRNRIRKTKDRKAAAELFQHSILNERFQAEAAFRDALASSGLAQAYTVCVWTSENLRPLFSLPSTWRYAGNTVIYVAFNVGFGLFLTLSTFDLPAAQAATFRVIWILPRILPPVFYVLMWK